MTESLIVKLLSITTDRHALEILRLLKSRHRLDLAKAYNEGVKVGEKSGRAEVAMKILKQQAGHN